MQRVQQQLVGRAMTWGMRTLGRRFLREVEHAHAVSQQTLQAILGANGATAWGRHWGLNGHNAEEAFAAMPLTTYADYLPYLQRAAEGEPNVLTREPITYFSLTSGTTGAQKMIPVTRTQTRLTLRHMLTPLGLANMTGLLGPMRGRALQIMTEQINGQTAGGIPTGAATSSSGVQRRERAMRWFWSSPTDVVRVQDQAAARYLHLLFALGEEHLWCIMAFFSSTLLLVLRDLAARAPRLLQDLADGTITPELDVSTLLRARLQELLRPNPARARALWRLLETGQFHVRTIWPEVGAVMAASSGTFRFYTEQLAPYLHGLPLYSPVYSSSEGVVGLGLPGQPGYLLPPAAAYHEFVPVEEAERPDARPLRPGQLEIGREYEVVLTTFGGLTRYRLSDVVQMLGYHGQTPRLEFVQRKGQVINLVGEKASEAQISAAFRAACERTGAAVLDYIVTPDADRTPPRYLLLVEGLHGGAGTDDHGRADGAVDRGEGLDALGLLAAFEEALRARAPEYHACRLTGELAAPAALLLSAGSFERYRELRVAAGASASQVKVPHVMPDPGFAFRYFPAHAYERVELSEFGVAAYHSRSR